MPRHTTRERRMYVSAARTFRAAFHDLYLFPLHSRRDFRTSCDFHDDNDALSQLSYHPTLFGPCHAGENAYSTPAYDAALIYFTMRGRRPRVLLMEVARAIRSELGGARTPRASQPRGATRSNSPTNTSA
jgi:hypothetical protein